MAYKITKYKGKHKIKDTKTGKSVGIDIEKYMKGGSATKYADGADFECPEGDIECEERKRLGIPPPIDSSLEGSPQHIYSSGLTEEKDKRLEASSVGSITPEGPVFAEDYLNITASGAPGSGSSSPEDFAAQSKNDDIYNIPNPYAGVDVPTAAFTLGQSIENKDALGIVGSSAKILSGLARTGFSGAGYQNRYNEVMKKYQEDQKNKKNPVQYFAYGGKKDEELATGEYMHGITNENIEPHNAEVEQGEYFQTNKGDIAEVVGDKHSKGGEKIQMEEDDRVLSDKLKLGAKTAKMLAEKYDIKLKAKNTYADVLDKYKRKSKLKDLIEEEADIIKKVGEQAEVKDSNTRDFNLQVLTKKKQEIDSKKGPIEEQRKVIFEELFEIQEESKPKDKNSSNEFEYGGKLESLAKEYGIDIERAKELVQNFQDGGDKKKGAAKKEVRPGQSKTDKGFFGNVTEDEYDEFVQRNSFWFDFDDFDPSNVDDVKRLQKTYNNITSGNKVRIDGKFGEQTASMLLGQDPIKTEPISATGLEGALMDPINFKNTGNPTPDDVNDPLVENNIAPSNDLGLAGVYLFPDETPLPPTALQGTIKPNRQFDRVTGSEIDVVPYLQSLKDSEQMQINNLEGLSPNVRAAVLANVAANTQNQESQVRNQIDTANLASKEKALYTNAQIQAREENASAADSLNFEQRQYRAQALTDLDLNNYYSQLQALNKQKFMDIHNLNLVNSANEDVYFDGQTFRRKTSDTDILQKLQDSMGIS